MSPKVNTFNLLPGFSDPVLKSQEVFRKILEAMAHPGRLTGLDVDLQAPRPFQQAAAAICLTLLDFETPLWTDLPAASDAVHWLKFHCGCPWVSSPSAAAFAFISSGSFLPSLEHFSVGRDEYPEKSATLIIQVENFLSGETRCLRGPGIQSVERLSVQGLSKEFWPFWRINHGLFPLGVDLLLTSGREMVALPRTTEIGE
jgi:alpha-D-ribose 1-methylphosphonate 5-triphosphate synthase subunit PhnH